jgi:hypothetical protein
MGTVIASNLKPGQQVRGGNGPLTVDSVRTATGNRLWINTKEDGTYCIHADAVIEVTS